MTELSTKQPIDTITSGGTPNAMVFQVIRTGYNYFFDGTTVVYLGSTEPPKLVDLSRTPTPGESWNAFREQEELRQVLEDGGVRYITKTSETIHVITRFCI